MNFQRIVWFIDRFVIYVVLFVLSVFIIFSLAYEQGLLSIIAMALFFLALYKGLVRVKILANSVIVRSGKVVFFVPEKTARNRFDFVSRGQSIVELPRYQLLDRPFKIEIFFSGREGTVWCCRLSLRFAYLMSPAAWQQAYDSFVEHGERLPLEVKKLLQRSCACIELQPVTITSDHAIREYLSPVVSHLNHALECVGLEVVDVQCSFSEGPTHARFLAVDQQDVEKGSTQTVFRWHVRNEESLQRGKGSLLEVPVSASGDE